MRVGTCKSLPADFWEAYNHFLVASKKKVLFFLYFPDSRGQLRDPPVHHMSLEHYDGINPPIQVLVAQPIS